MRTADTVPIYRLHGLGWHPGLVIDKESGLAVKGELWAVDERTLAMLDEYEGTPDWFLRSQSRLPTLLATCKRISSMGKCRSMCRRGMSGRCRFEMHFLGFSLARLLASAYDQIGWMTPPPESPPCFESRCRDYFDGLFQFSSERGRGVYHQLDLRGKASKTVHGEAVSRLATPKEREVLTIKAGQRVTVQWKFIYNDPKETLKEVTIHFYAAGAEKTSQASLPKLDRTVLAETALNMDFTPKETNEGELHFTIDKPGSICCGSRRSGALPAWVDMNSSPLSTSKCPEFRRRHSMRPIYLLVATVGLILPLSVHAEHARIELKVIPHDPVTGAEGEAVTAMPTPIRRRGA